MSYCPHSGRTVNDGDEFCANCARKIFLRINDGRVAQSRRGQWIPCPKCHGAALIVDPDGHGTGNMRCGYPGCENGRVWVNDSSML
jgi:hypothetical protein